MAASSEASLLQVEKERAEEASDLRKRLHKPVRAWYKTQEELKARCGRFPIFWQDTGAWAHWSAVYKAYIVATEDADVKVSAATAPASSSAGGTAAAAEGAAGPKKRRSRFGNSAPAAEGADPPKKKRKSRFGGASLSAGGGGGAAGSVDLTQLSAKDLEVIGLRGDIMAVGNKLLTVALDAARVAQDPNRSPSPLPQYDAKGMKVNNREQRMRKVLLQQQEALNDKLYKLEPALRPAGFKIIRKVRIPIDEHPGYNFIGLVIGPRGQTHRRMEAETGCKISIRGKGSVKEGRSRHSKPADEEPLHVIITGDDYDRVEKAEQVSVLLSTVTCHANRAHNLTRSP
jgi:splicing factor 1